MVELRHYSLDTSSSTFDSTAAGSSMITSWIISKSPGPNGFQAIVFHGLYNIASITVLSLITAQSHSLLNVGKRIFNVFVATISFGEHFGLSGFVGLGIAAVGGVFYSCTKSKPNNYQYSPLEQKGGASRGRRFVPILFLIFLSVAFYAFKAANVLVTTSEDSFHFSKEYEKKGNWTESHDVETAELLLSNASITPHQQTPSTTLQQPTNATQR